MAPKSTTGEPTKKRGKKPSVRTREEVRRWFSTNGRSISGWAKARGFSPSLTHAVLMGERKCLRGQSHEIAIALGLKENEEFDFDDGGPQL
ncbi:MAG: DNA-binding protein [Chromatiaceae bacterium]|nr:DNA-binding protein [Chromatiaceae bacterium]MCP5314922.1 DNA-binding protein [Chromatiaceae bacterium]